MRSNGNLMHNRAKEKVAKGRDDIEELIQACVAAKEIYRLSYLTMDLTDKLGYKWKKYKGESASGG